MIKKLVHVGRLYRWSDLESNRSLPPSSPGVYAWFFDHVSDRVPTNDCVIRDGSTLLYVGISSRGRNGTLVKRVRGLHFRGNAAGSTLRLSLGCLLEGELGTILRRVGSGNRKTFGSKETVLTRWMADHALVSWVEVKNPKPLEEYLIKSLDLPLNLDGNEHNQFWKPLSELRRRGRERAINLPILK
ncbi:MAG TPA: hypothetical protein VNF28_03560 [Candidatus Binataceae bacterium]|nr:hypothetical protein [Candidatus Binataceae bacterium]